MATFSEYQEGAEPITRNGVLEVLGGIGAFLAGLAFGFYLAHLAAGLAVLVG